MALIYDDEDEKTQGQHDDLGVPQEHREAEADEWERRLKAPSASDALAHQEGLPHLDSQAKDNGETSDGKSSSPSEINDAESGAGSSSDSGEAADHERRGLNSSNATFGFRDEGKIGANKLFSKLPRFGRSKKGGEGKNKKNKWLPWAGAGGAGILALFIGGYITLVPLKIEDLVNNIQNHFNRGNTSAVQKEEQRLFRKYISLQRNHCKTGKTGYIDSSCSVNFGNGKDPVTNLFKTWRQAKLEDKLAKDGIHFHQTGGKTFVTIKGETQELSSVMSRGDLKELAAELDSKLEDETKWNRVMTRFKLGRLLEEKYHIKRCELFCGQKKYLNLKTYQAQASFKEFLLKRILQPAQGAQTEALACFLDAGCDASRTTPDSSNANNEFNGSESDYDKRASEVAKELASKYGTEVDDLSKVGDLSKLSTDGFTGDSDLEKALKTYYKTNTTKDTVDSRSGKVIAKGKTTLALDSSGNPELKTFSQVLVEQLTDKTLTSLTNLAGDQIASVVSKVGETSTGIGAIVAGMQIFDQIATMAKGAAHFSTALSHMSYVVHSVGAVSTFMTFRSFADEMKTGNTTPQEVGSFVDALGPCSDKQLGCSNGGGGAEVAPTYDYYVSSNGSTSTTTGSLFANLFSSKASAAAVNVADATYTHNTSTQKYYKCDDGSQLKSSQAICPEEQFGNINGKGVFSGISNVLSSPPLKQISDIWASDLNPVHDFFTLVNGTVGALVGGVSSLGDHFCSIPGAHYFSFAVPGIGVFLGLYCNVKGVVQNAINSLLGSMVNWLIPSPLSINMSGARTFDEMAAGADQSSSDFGTNVLGAKQLTTQQAANIQNQQTQEEKLAFEQQPLTARIFNTNSQYSLVSKLAMSVPLGNARYATSTSIASLISNPFSKALGSLSSIFAKSGSAFADTPALPDFYNIPQYGYPSDSDSTNPPPQSAIQQISDPNNQYYNPSYSKISASDAVDPDNPDLYWQKYCALGSDSTGQKINPAVVDAYNQNASNNIDQTTGMPTPKQTDPCQLIQATVGSVGGYFACNNLTPDDLADVSSGANNSSGTLTLTYGNLGVTVYLPNDNQP